MMFNHNTLSATAKLFSKIIKSGGYKLGFTKSLNLWSSILGSQRSHSAHVSYLKDNGVHEYGFNRSVIQDAFCQNDIKISVEVALNLYAQTIIPFFKEISPLGSTLVDYLKENKNMSLMCCQIDVKRQGLAIIEVNRPGYVKIKADYFSADKGAGLAEELRELILHLVGRGSEHYFKIWGSMAQASETENNIAFQAMLESHESDVAATIAQGFHKLDKFTFHTLSSSVFSSLELLMERHKKISNFLSLDAILVEKFTDSLAGEVLRYIEFIDMDDENGDWEVESAAEVVSDCINMYLNINAKNIRC